MLFLPREEGQGLVEYALILVLVAIVVIVILALLGPARGNIVSNIVNAIEPIGDDGQAQTDRTAEQDPAIRGPVLFVGLA
jgi:pilus assembly protein Flp/PilA